MVSSGKSEYFRWFQAENTFSAEKASFTLSRNTNSECNMSWCNERPHSVTAGLLRGINSESGVHYVRAKSSVPWFFFSGSNSKPVPLPPSSGTIL